MYSLLCCMNLVVPTPNIRGNLSFDLIFKPIKLIPNKRKLGNIVPHRVSIMQCKRVYWMNKQPWNTNSHTISHHWHWKHNYSLFVFNMCVVIKNTLQKIWNMHMRGGGGGGGFSRRSTLKNTGKRITRSNNDYNITTINIVAKQQTCSYLMKHTVWAWNTPMPCWPIRHLKGGGGG